MRTKRKNRSPRWQRHGPKFIQLFRYLLDSPAYMSLSVWARAALIEVNRGCNSSNNGRAYLEQIRGPCNTEPPKATVATVVRWLGAQEPLPLREALPPTDPERSAA